MPQEKPITQTGGNEAQAYQFAYTAGFVTGKYGDYQAAIPLMEQAVVLDSRRPDYWHMLGVAHRETGDRAKAAYCLREAARRAPDNAAYARDLQTLDQKVGPANDTGNAASSKNPEKQAAEYTELANGLVETYRNDAAVMGLRERAVALAPDNDSYRDNLVKAEDRIRARRYANMANEIASTFGDYKATISLLEEAIVYDRNTTAYYHMLGVTYFKAGQKEEAIRTLEKATGMDPESLIYAKALEAVKQMDPPAAQAIKIPPGQERQLAAEYGKVAQEIVGVYEDCDATRSLRERAVELVPENPAYRYELAYVYVDMDLQEQALPHLKKALELAPDNMGYYHLQGSALYDLERYEEAAASFRKMLELRPQDAIVWNNLGQALARQGEQAEAVKCLQKAIEIGGTEDDNAAFQANLRLLLVEINGDPDTPLPPAPGL